MTTPPRIFDWLLRRALPPGTAGDTIRGDLIEELTTDDRPALARLRFRLQVLSIVVRAHRLAGPTNVTERRGIMESLARDLRFAVRSLLQRPSFCAMVVVTLALGIGANTAIFSILHALVLRQLPVTNPSRLVVVSRNQLSLQYPLFRHFQTHSTTLGGLVAFRTAHCRLTTGDQTERVTAVVV